MNIDDKLNKILNLLENIQVDTTNTNKLADPVNNFDINMYIKCLIHELRTPISSVLLGLNIMEKKFLSYQRGETHVTPECTDDSLVLIRDLNQTIQYIEDTISKFCVIQNGNLILNKFEVFNINHLLNRIKRLLQHQIQEQNIIFETIIDDNINEYLMGDIINIKHFI